MILVTGGTGLIGSYLLKDLIKRNKRVRALYRSSKSFLLTDEERVKVQWVQCDILDITGLEQAMLGIEQVYHVAGLVSFNPDFKKDLYRINVAGTANVANAALNAGVKKIVHVSSVSALGRKRHDQIVNEEHQWTPETNNSIYGESKFLGEMEIWRASGEGLDAVIVNPSLVFGYGNWDAGSLSIFKNVYNGFPWYSHGGGGVVDVRDVSKAMIQLMDSDISAERFILSSENWSYFDLFSTVAKYFNTKKPHRRITPLSGSVGLENRMAQGQIK